MKFRKRVHGSSLIFVVIIFMFVLIVSTGMLSMVATNYTARVTESKRVENLYGSESGLDTAYNVIAKTIENANKSASKKIDTLRDDINNGKYYDYLDGDGKKLYALYADIDYIEASDKTEEQKTEIITDDNKRIEQVINNVFKDEFRRYIEGNLVKNVAGEKGTGTYRLNFDDESVKQTVSYSGAEIKMDENEIREENWKDNRQKLSYDCVIRYWLDDDGKPQKDIKPIYFEDCDSEESLKIHLTSTFMTDSSIENTAKVGKNERQIEETLEIRVPNYDEVSYKSTESSEIKDIPGIMVGKDLKIDSAAVEFNGDIFVEGNTDYSNDKIDEKYNSGIFINSKSQNREVKFNGNVSTRETFNLMNKVEVKVSGNLYAKNLYAGADENSQTNKSILDMSNSKIVLDNDLEMNADYNTEISVGKFYGINSEYNDTDENQYKNVSVDKKVKNSSSIIINKPQTSTLTIMDEAYIRGVAHIENESRYQTGESIGVKGNYKAYIDGNDEKGNPRFFEGNVFEKAEQFINYWTNNDSEYDTGGVVFENLDNTKLHSVGTVVYMDKDKKPHMKGSSDDTMDSAINGIIDSQKVEFASKVYKMSEEADIEDYDNAHKDNYTSIKVSDYLNLEDVSEYDKNNAIFSKNKPIAIVGKNAKRNYDDSYKIINVSKLEKPLYAVIVSNKDVIIDGDVDIRGNIITAGNLNIISNSDNSTKITYDKDITNSIQAGNSGVFKKVFTKQYSDSEKSNEDNKNIQYNSAEFLKVKFWKIKK